MSVRLYFILFLILTASCTEPTEQSQYAIDWDSSSLSIVDEMNKAEGFVSYGRVYNNEDGSFVAVYEKNGGIYSSYSANAEGKWIAQKQIVAPEILDCRVNMSNPELLRLSENRLFLAYNKRPVEKGVYPFCIALRVSENNGQTWSEEKIIYEAARSFEDGCWEPYMIKVQNSVQLYFANENRYRSTNEQEISLIVLDYHGNIQESARQVSFRSGHRDGMPVVIEANDSLYCAIEDNLGKAFKPYVVKTSKANMWNTPVLANSAERVAIAPNEFQDKDYVGAPYITKIDEHLFAMSFQSSKGRGDGLAYAKMDVCLLGDNLQPVSNIQAPFENLSHKSGLWNSIRYIGNNTIIACSTISTDTKVSIAVIKGSIKKIDNE